MDKQIRRRQDAHMRVNIVCNENSAIFDATPGGQKTRATLATNVADVDRLFAAQQQATEERRAATETLIDGRRMVREAAKAIAKIGKVVNLDNTTMTTLRVPGSVSDDELTAYARGLRNHVAAHVDAFVAEGLPTGVLQKLDTGLQRMVTAREAAAVARQRFTAAGESIREAQATSDTMVDALEVIAVNTPAANPEVLTTLRMARRIGPRAAGDVTPPAPPQPTPTDKAA